MVCSLGIGKGISNLCGGSLGIGWDIVIDGGTHAGIGGDTYRGVHGVTRILLGYMEVGGGVSSKDDPNPLVWLMVSSSSFDVDVSGSPHTSGGRVENDTDLSGLNDGPGCWGPSCAECC